MIVIVRVVVAMFVAVATAAAVFMVVRMLVIVRVVAAAALAVVVMVVVMILGIDESLGEPLLDGDRGLARRLGVLDGERHDLGAEPHIVDGAEVVPAQAPLAIE